MARLLGRYSPGERSTMMEITSNARAGGHDLASWKMVEDSEGGDNGYQLRCKLCGQVAQIGTSGVMLMYSLLGAVCPGKVANEGVKLSV